MGLQLTAGSSTTTLNVYDVAVSTATANINVVDQHIIAGNNNSIGQWFGPNGIDCTHGIYFSLAGTGAVVIIYYSLM